MFLFMILFSWALFYVLTPGMFIKLPPTGSANVVAAVHGLAFAVIYSLTHKAVWAYVYS